MKLSKTATVLTVLTALATFANVECHNVPDFGKGPLHEDIQYFLDLLPINDIVAVVLEYASNDVKFQETLKDMQNSDFKELMVEVQAITEFKDFLEYLEKNGIDVYTLVKKFNDLLDVNYIEPSMLIETMGESSRTGEGMAGLFQDVKKLVSYDVIIHGYVYKMRTSVTFRDFVAQLKSEGNQKFVDKLYANQRFLAYRSKLIGAGIDVALIEDVVYTVLGINFPSQKQYEENHLSRDIDDFVALIFNDQVKDAIVTHLITDEKLQSLLNYLASEEFFVLVRSVEALPEYQEIVLFLNRVGLDTNRYIQFWHKFIDMEDYVPLRSFAGNGKYRSMRHSSVTDAFKSMIEDIVDAIPVLKIGDLYLTKMHQSIVFVTFVEQLRSAEFRNILNSFYKHEVYVERRHRAAIAGLDLEVFKELSKEIF